MDNSWVLEHVTTRSRIYLEDGDNTIGRHSSCKFVLIYEYLSRNHVNLTVSNNRVTIQLMNALNGVFVNNKIVKENGHELHEGDKICLGVISNAQTVPATYAIFLLKKRSNLVDPIILISDDEDDDGCDTNNGNVSDNSARNLDESTLASSKSTYSKGDAETTNDKPNADAGPSTSTTTSSLSRILHMPKLPAVKEEILNETTNKICDIFGEVDESILDPLINISPYVFNKLQNANIATTTKKICDGDIIEVADDVNISEDKISTTSHLMREEVVENDSSAMGHSVSVNEMASSNDESRNDSSAERGSPVTEQATLAHIKENIITDDDDYDEDFAMSQALLKEMKDEIDKDDFDIGDIDFSPTEIKMKDNGAKFEDDDIIVIESDDDADFCNKVAEWSSKLLSQTVNDASQIYPMHDSDDKSSESSSDCESEEPITVTKKSKAQRIYSSSSDEENTGHIICKADSTVSPQPKLNKCRVRLKSCNLENLRISTKADEVTSSLFEKQSKPTALKSDCKEPLNEMESRRSEIQDVTKKTLSSRLLNRSKSSCVERPVYKAETEKTFSNKLQARESKSTAKPKPTRESIFPYVDDFKKIPVLIAAPHIPKHRGRMRAVSAVNTNDVSRRCRLQEPIVKKNCIKSSAVTIQPPKETKKLLSSRLLNRSKSVCVERSMHEENTEKSHKKKSQTKTTHNHTISDDFEKKTAINAKLHLPKDKGRPSVVSVVKKNDISSRSRLQESPVKENKPVPQPTDETKKTLSLRLLNRSKSFCADEDTRKTFSSKLHLPESRPAKATRKRTLSDVFENGPALIDAPHLPKHKGKLRGVSAVDKDEQRRNAVLDRTRAMEHMTELKAKWFSKRKPDNKNVEELKEKRREQLRKLTEKKTEMIVKNSTELKRKINIPTCANTNRGAFLTKEIENTPAKKPKLVENVKLAPRRSSPKRRATIESFSQSLKAADTEWGPPTHYSRPPERKEARAARLQRTCNRVTFADMEKEFKMRFEIGKATKRVRFDDNVTIHFIERIEGASAKVKQQKDSTKVTLSTYNERREWSKVHNTVDCTSKIIINILSWGNQWLSVRNADAVSALELLLPMPDKFQSNIQYIETIIPLMKLELLSGIERDYKMNTSTFKVKLIEYIQYEEYCVLITNYECPNEKKFSLYTLSSGDKYLKETFASLSTTSRMAGGIWETTFQILLQNVTIEHLKLVKTLIVRPVVDNMRVDLGAFNAVYKIKHTPLFSRILNPCKNLQPRSLSISKQNTYKGLSQLNMKQMEICMCTYDRLVDDATPSITLIQGPPGTGKSLVISNLSLQCMYGDVARMCDRKVLICSHSNTAVDNITKNLKRALDTTKLRKFKLLRFGISERISSAVKSVSLCHYLKCEQRKKRDKQLSAENINNLMQQKLQLTNEIEELNRRPTYDTSLQQHLQQKERQLRKLNEILYPELTKLEHHEFSKKYIEEANIVCTTLSSCVTLANYVDYFDICIIDEATQCTEPWTLLPLRFGVRGLVLVGDTQQLPATVLSQKANRLGLGSSMFDRLERNLKHAESKGLVLHTKIYKLDTQYRMHPEICKWPNKYFYENQLINDQCTFKSAPIIPYCVVNLSFTCDTNDVNSRGVHNDEEAGFVAKLLEELIQIMPMNKYKYGLITPYANHCIALRRAIPNKIEITPSTVDSYQGLQCDVGILSYARTRGVGFLKNHQRLNVALTRPRHCLIICGNFNDLKSVDMWKHLLDDAAARNVYFNLSRQDCEKDLKSSLMNKLIRPFE